MIYLFADTYSDFTSVSIGVLSWSRIQSDIPHCIWWWCLFSSPPFYDSVTFFMILFVTLWKAAEHWRTCLTLDLSEFRQFGPENHRSAVGAFQKHITPEHVCLLILTVIRLRWWLPGSSTVQFLFSFVISTCLVGRYSETADSLFLILSFTHFNTHWIVFLLAVIITLVIIYDDFSYLSFLLYYWNSTRKTCLFSHLHYSVIYISINGLWIIIHYYDKKLLRNVVLKS